MDRPTNAQLPVSTPGPQAIQQPVLITGITGFIAGHLAERLLREGIPVRGTARRLGQTFEVS